MPYKPWFISMLIILTRNHNQGVPATSVAAASAGERLPLLHSSTQSTRPTVTNTALTPRTTGPMTPAAAHPLQPSRLLSSHNAAASSAGGTQETTMNTLGMRNDNSQLGAGYLRSSNDAIARLSTSFTPEFGGYLRHTESAQRVTLLPRRFCDLSPPPLIGSFLSPVL